MPVEFGKNIDRNVPGTSDGGVLATLLSGSEEAMLRRHRKAQSARMAPARPAPTMRESERLKVYIYNAGPFTRTITTLGSIGIAVLPGLPETDVLKGLYVALNPYTVAGLPAEQVCGEPRGQWLEDAPGEHLRWTDADGEVFQLMDRPGLDRALRIIGGHEQSPRNPYAASPFEQGCFVSTIPEQSEQPDEPKELSLKASPSERREYAKASLQYEEDIRLWLKWESSVRAAQQRFTDWSMRRGEEQCLAYSNGTYVRDEELYVLSRVFRKTEKDWNFLAGTSANVKTKSCWSCGRSVKAGVPKCECGELQISLADYEERRKQVLEGTSA